MQQQADQHLLTTNAPLLISGSSAGSPADVTRLELPGSATHSTAYSVTTIATTSYTETVLLAVLAVAFLRWAKRTHHRSFAVLCGCFALSFALQAGILVFNYLAMHRADGGYPSDSDVLAAFELVSSVQSCIAAVSIVAAIGLIRAARRPDSICSPGTPDSSTVPPPPATAS